MSKYYVETLTEVGSHGPGQYIFKNVDGKTRAVTLTGTVGAEQAPKKQCDINYILQDYQRTGMIQHAKNYAGKYDDVTIDSFQDAMFLVKRAENMFNDLPSSLRKRFNNDPGEFLQFSQNPENKEEMVKLGMIAGNDGLTQEALPSGAPVVDSAGPDGIVGTADDIKTE